MWLAPASDSLCRGFPFIVHGAKQHIPVRADEAPAHLAFTPVPHRLLVPFRADRSICLMHLPWPWCITSDSLVPKSCLTLATPWTAARQAPPLWDFPGKSTGAGWRFLLQGIFPTQGSNAHLLLGRWTLYHWATEGALFITWSEVAQSCLTLCDPLRLLCPWDFSRQEYWSGLPFPSPGDLPDPGIEPGSPALQAEAFTVWVSHLVPSLAWICLYPRFSMVTHIVFVIIFLSCLALRTQLCGLSRRC